MLLWHFERQDFVLVLLADDVSDRSLTDGFALVLQGYLVLWFSKMIAIIVTGASQIPFIHLPWLLFASSQIILNQALLLLLDGFWLQESVADVYQICGGVLLVLVVFFEELALCLVVYFLGLVLGRGIK